MLYFIHEQIDLIRRIDLYFEWVLNTFNRNILNTYNGKYKLLRFQRVCMLWSFIGLLLFDSFLENSFTNIIITMFPTFLTFCFFVMLLLKVQKEHSYCTRYYTYAYIEQNTQQTKCPHENILCFVPMFREFKAQ